MDLQLYRIDDQNYLVDFRNLGYRSIKKESPDGTPATELPNSADAVRARKPELRNGASKSGTADVSSPYLFLETAVRLIVELASPQ